MYAEYLSFSGFRVIEASTGTEAVEKAFALRPDVILMDLSLPGMDGWAATRQLKNDERTKRHPRRRADRPRPRRGIRGRAARGLRRVRHQAVPARRARPRGPPHAGSPGWHRRRPDRPLTRRPGLLLANQPGHAPLAPPRSLSLARVAAAAPGGCRGAVDVPLSPPAAATPFRRCRDRPVPPTGSRRRACWCCRSSSIVPGFRPARSTARPATISGRRSTGFQRERSCPRRVAAIRSACRRWAQMRPATY